MFSCSSCIPSFRDCVISVTGFTSESVPTREQVKCAIDMVGACYMGPLCKDYTTHLVCLNTESDKYRATTTWKTSIHVVRAEWLLECIKKWERVDEKDFVLREEKGQVNEDDVSTGDEDNEEVNEDDISTEDEDEDRDEVTPIDKVTTPVEEEAPNDDIPTKEVITNMVIPMEEEEKEEVIPMNEEVHNGTTSMEEEEITPIPNENDNSQQSSQLHPGTEHASNHSQSTSSETHIKPHVFLLSSDQSADNHTLTISSLGGEFIQTNQYSYLNEFIVVSSILQQLI